MSYYANPNLAPITTGVNNLQTAVNKIPPVSTTPETAGVNTGTTTATTVTSNGSAHTKGSYTQLIASTTKQANGILIQVFSSAPTVTGLLGYIFDIALGGSGSEVDFIKNIPYYVNLSASNIPYSASTFIYLPVQIAVGARISARCQDQIGGKSLYMAVTLME